MARINQNHGGKRKGAGRKSKAEEMELQSLLDKCWTKADREACIKKLASKAKDPLSTDFMDAAKLLMAYAFGKPKERLEHSGTLETTLILPKANAGS
jgi:hypothetical protein